MSSVDRSEQPKNVISFCSGYAGIERGLELAGVATRALAYVEIEAFAAANLVAKMESGFLAAAPIWSDLKTFPAQLFRDRVDILTAGYPCQPFSAAGKRAGKDDPRHLWPYIREHIETIRPIQCFFENVEGHISLGLREVIEDLESLGYATTWGIFSAAEVGAPHQRKRVYILAHAKRDFIRQQSRWRSGENGESTSFSGIDGKARFVANSARRNERDQRQMGQDQKRSIELGAESRGGGVDLANAEGVRVQGLRSGWQQEPNPHGKAQLFVRESKRSTAPNWLPEPQLGRVVDGCADRVDRLRLLGNGVVPQTAAEAWQVLEQQIWQS